MNLSALTSVSTTPFASQWLLRSVPQPHRDWSRLLMHMCPSRMGVSADAFVNPQKKRKIGGSSFHCYFCSALHHICKDTEFSHCAFKTTSLVLGSVFSVSALHPGWPLDLTSFHCLCFPPVKTQPKVLHTSKAFPWEESLQCCSQNNHKVLKAEGRLLLPGKAAQMES